MKKSLPTVTFVTPTLNSEATICKCILSVRRLNYPKRLIQMLIMDDGSTDRTLSIVNRFPFCKVVRVKTGGPEEATAIGFNMAKSHYVVNFSSDNVLPERNWLKRMIAPLEKNKDITASESFRYTYVPDDKVLNRYFALFGMNDPIALYLNKRDRSAYFEIGWHLPTPATDHGDYYETQFTKNTMPTLGANGFVIRTKTIQKVTKDPKKFSHIDSCVDLMELGYARYAFVKTTLWHITGEDLNNYFYKRRRYALELYFKKQHMRRYHLYDPKTDRIRLITFIILSLTVVEPTLRSIRGFVKIRDVAWFLHPVICFLIVLNYAYIYLQHTSLKYKR